MPDRPGWRDPNVPGSRDPWKCAWCGRHHVVPSLARQHETRCDLNERAVHDR